MFSLVITARNEMKWCATAMQMFALFSMYKLIVADFNEKNYIVMMLALAAFDLKNRATQIALAVITAFHGAVWTLPMPAKLPFLHYLWSRPLWISKPSGWINTERFHNWPLCNSAISFCVFASFFAYTHYAMYQNTKRSKEN